MQYQYMSEVAVLPAHVMLHDTKLYRYLIDVSVVQRMSCASVSCNMHTSSGVSGVLTWLICSIFTSCKLLL